MFPQGSRFCPSAIAHKHITGMCGRRCSSQRSCSPALGNGCGAVVEAQCFESQGCYRICAATLFTMFSTLTFNTDMSAYAATYTTTRDAYLLAAKALKEATGPYKATRDAYVAATATYTKSLYE